MHKPPEKMKRGWKRHAEAHNALIDYVHKTHPIPAHGHRETVNGTMPPARPDELVMQFTPRIFAGRTVSDPVINITPGYVFGSWHDGSDSDSSDTEATAAHLPEVQAWVFEPKIGTTLLTNNPPPGLALTKGETNFIYLELTWKAYRASIGGHDYHTDYAFKCDYNLKATGLPENTGYTNAGGGNHRHSIAAGGTATIIDGTASTPPQPGIHVRIDKIFYTLSAAKFIVQTAAAAPLETELKTHILAGYVYLDANGDIAADGSDDGLRWFIQGAIWANRPPTIASGHSDPDRGEPLAPTAATTNDIPGIA